MPVVPAGTGGMSGPSTFDKLKMGAMMGGSVGLIIGFIFGATNIIRFGPGPNGIMRTLGQYMLGSAATFGVFMSIGTTIRTESSPIATEAYRRARAQPIVYSRWDKEFIRNEEERRRRARLGTATKS